MSQDDFETMTFLQHVYFVKLHVDASYNLRHVIRQIDYALQDKIKRLEKLAKYVYRCHSCYMTFTSRTTC